MADTRRDEFPEYSTHWAKGEDGSDLEKPFLAAPEFPKDDCYGLDENARAAEDDNLKARQQLTAASILCFIFLILELIGGFMANSLAIMTDAAHLMSDIAGFLISLASMYLAQRRATDTHSFGYHRAEILGSMMSVALIWLITGVIVYEAIGRIRNPEDVKGKLMFFVALGGLIVNFVMGMVLMQSGHGHSHGGLPGSDTCGGHGHSEEEEVSSPAFPSRGGLLSPPVQSHGHSHEGGNHGHAHGPEPAKKKKHVNINVQAAFIHVVGDAVQSAGVMMAAALIWYEPRWRLADPICSFVFAILVLGTTTRLIWQASHILMEGMPEGIDSVKVRGDLENIAGVLEVHDLHIWSISVGKPALSVHLLADERAEGVLGKATDICNKHGIHHVTIQVEREKDGLNRCQQDD